MKSGIKHIGESHIFKWNEHNYIFESNKTSLKIFQSTNIKNYKPILEGLLEDFGYTYWNAILTWCDIIDDDPRCKNKYWQVWLVEYERNVIGICGLFSHKDDNNEELWLGWFGIVPALRNKHLGEEILGWMETEAKRLGSKRILSYVDEDGKPLSFYYRNGYKLLGSVKEYLANNRAASKEDFESLNDHVIAKEIL